MLRERWQHILEKRADAVALHDSEGALTFRDLDRLARIVPTADAVILAQGDPRGFIATVLAGFIQGRPVQVVEQDRAPHHIGGFVPEGTCLIKQTVGGSGVRRRQFFSAEQVACDVDGLRSVFGLADGCVCVAAISHAHSFGLTVAALQTLLNGMTVHWLAQPFPALLESALKSHDRVFLPAVPSLWKAWLKSGAPLGNVALAVSAGSPLSLDLEKRAWDDHGIKIHNLYGASECGAISYDASSTPRTDASDLGSLLPGVSAQVDEAGFLAVESGSVGIGYDELLEGEVFGEVRFQTMDKVRIIGERLKFVEYAGAGINLAGRKISPAEVGGKMRTASGISGIHVHGIFSRDPERFQEVVAVIDLPQGEITPEFRSRACRGLAPWEVPRQWIGRSGGSCFP